MANNLFPVFNVPSTLAQNVKPKQDKYSPAPLFDAKTGDFMTNGSKQILYGSGYDAWVLWCTKTILTQRGAHIAYSHNIGIEADEAFGQPDRKAQESAFERTITEALLADPKGRTMQVNNFTFTWSDDGVEIGCSVLNDAGNTADITAQLNR